MGTVEPFDHTADVGLLITAESLDDLFRTAAGGLFDTIVVNRGAIRATLEEPVALESDSTADLLVDWLNELIFRLETRHRLYNAFEIAVAETEAGARLSGRIAGEPIDPERHELDHEVKAVTRHEAELRRDGSSWTARVILDI